MVLGPSETPVLRTRPQPLSARPESESFMSMIRRRIRCIAPTFRLPFPFRGERYLKAFFFATFLILAALSGVAWKIAPDRGSGDKTPLIWCSDDNPFRRAQMTPFNHLYPQYEVRLDPANTYIEKIIVQSLAGV